jgi:GNAT superfamily N-acetyltransferase
MLALVIREYESRDAPGAAALIVDGSPWLTTPAGLDHEVRSRPARAKRRSWVAEEDGEIVGWAEAEFEWSTDAADAADVWIFVRDDRRRRGIGSALYELGAEHLLGEGASELLGQAGDAAGRRFVERRGYVKTRDEVLSSVDPRTIDTSRLEEELERLDRDGFRLVTLAEAERRPRELHALYASAAVDMPADHPQSNMPYEEWHFETLGKPDLSRDGSFVVLAGDRPVALSFVDVDPERGMAEQELTGTAPDHRRRGLARAAKLAVARWCAENGIVRLSTSNDDENAGMLKINRELGFEPTEMWSTYVLRV